MTRSLHPHWPIQASGLGSYECPLLGRSYLRMGVCLHPSLFRNIDSLSVLDLD